MQAIVVREFGGPEVLRQETIARPQPAPGQLLVKIYAAGVNPVDTYIRSGIYPIRPQLPYTPGHDAAGTVEALGAGVTDFQVGERVFLCGTKTGTYAPYAVCETWQAARLPQAAGFSEGACLWVACGTAWRALHHRGGLRPGQRVLVHGGTGGVGTAAVQLASAFGARVTATGSSERGRHLLRTLGADHTFDHTAPDYFEEAVEQATGGRGFDLIIEMLANENLGRDAQGLAARGRIVVVGSRGPVEINARELMSRDADIRGLALNNASREDIAEIQAGLQAALAKGTLKPVINVEVSLADAAQAHRLVMSPGAYGNVVLVRR